LRRFITTSGRPRARRTTAWRYGEFQEPFWRCDHVDMIGHNLDTADLGKFQFDHILAVDAVIGQL
jgi:hypothetical protein